MVYQKLRHNSRLALDPSYPNIDQSNFKECDWTDFNEGTVEAIPPYVPLIKEKEVNLCMHVDCDHANDKQTRETIHDIFEHVIS